MEHQATQPSGTPQATHPSAGHGAAGHGTPVGPELAEAIAKGYEPHDIGLRPVFTFIAGLSVTLIVVLAAIYGIMMALAAYDRSEVAARSPVDVKLPAPYAPLQPSLGIYGNHDNDHNTLDWQDMDAMRYKAQVALKSTGKIGDRSFIPIESAITMVIEKKLLVTRPVVMPVVPQKYAPAGPGSFEGFNSSYPVKTIDPKLNPNDMNRLNNLGN